jgi:quercetin dioxygenase-like cupin family protein
MVGRLSRHLQTFFLAAALAFPLSVPRPGLAQMHGSGHATSGSACRPLSEKRSEIGCYILSAQPLGGRPEGALFWHLDTYPTLEAAEAAKGARGTVVEAFGRVWLLTIAEGEWRAAGGKRVAEIGPIPLPPAADLTAMYVAATFLPGGSVAPHRHSGPELWYTLNGEQCLETPDGKTVVRSGEGTIIPGDTPMAPLALGSDTPRSLILVLHDAAQPASSPSHDWTPKGLCRG